MDFNGPDGKNAVQWDQESKNNQGYYRRFLINELKALEP